MTGLDKTGRQHRGCTGCKSDVGPYADLHKYRGGVFCNNCWSRMNYRPAPRSSFRSIWDFVNDVWDWLKVAASTIFHTKDRKRIQSVSRVKFQSTNMKAKNIPRNPAQMNPQKR